MPDGPIRVLALCLFAALWISGCESIGRRAEDLRDRLREPEKPEIFAVPDALFPFGNPSGATTDPGNRSNYLLVKSSYILSYNNSRGTANWIAWRTTAEDLGESLPRPGFEPDPSLPFGFVRITPTDYSGGGYDRGHLVPSADRFGRIESNAETFLMTNIVPQTGDLNQYPWQKLESYARGIVRRGEDVYTIAGVYGDKGRLRGRVTVPTNCWKIIVVLPRGSHEITSSTRVIAVDMPNIEGIAKDWWQKYLTNIRAVEQKTGYNFLSSLPQDLQETLETKIDHGAGPTRR